jgi:hypothetical protein
VRTRSSVPSTRLTCGKARLAVTAAASALILGTGSLCGSAAVAATAGPGLTPDPAAPAASAPTVTLTGSVPALPAGSAAVYAEVQLPLDPNSQGVPRQLDDVAVASESVTSPEFSLPVPDSATLGQAERYGKGIVNFDIIVLSGDKTTAWGLSVPITGTPSALNQPQLAVERAQVVHVPALPAFHAAQTDQVTQALGVPDRDPPPECAWNTDGGEQDRPTRIGEVHVAHAGGVSDAYEYDWQNDETVSWGVSASPNSNWSEGGTGSVTNSLGASGGQTFGRGADTYVDTEGYYQEYRGVGVTDGCDGYDFAFLVKQVGTAGNVDTGKGKPAGSPYKDGCINDPLHFELQPESVWDYDHGQSETYGGAASFAGFSFSVSEGFSSDVQDDYTTSDNAATTWICGTRGKQPTDTPIIYNTTG